MNPIYAALGTTIFTTMSGLSTQNRAINLGQGFPEDDGFPEVRAEAAKALIDGSNQYAPMRGLPALIEAVAGFYERTQGLKITPEQVLITSGATEAIAASLLALISPGDEVIVFEPMYDAYRPLIARAGGVVVEVPLLPPEWRFSPEALTVAFSERTRAVLLTTPNNPTCRALSAADWDIIAQLAVKHQAYVISDEVWEQVVFDGRAHRSVRHIEALDHLSVKIGSAGKIFALTGWKVGFVCASEALITQIGKAHQFLTFSTPPGLQAGVAFGLGLPPEVFTANLAALQASRDRLRAGLEAEGFRTLTSDGTYFLNVDLRASGLDVSGMDFALRAVAEAGVAVIPVEAFCATGGAAYTAARSIIRLCFAKRDATRDRGIEALGRARRVFTGA